MNHVSNKIKAVINHFGLNNYSFAKRIGVTATTIDSIVNGRLQKDGGRKKTKPGYDVLMAIINEFEVSTDFLFGKATSMFKSEIGTYDGVPKAVVVDSKGNENVLYIPVKAKAGYLHGYGDPNFIETLPSFSMPHLTNGTYRCFEVEGNSMVPTFSSGDLVYGKYVESLKDIKDNKVYIVISKEDGIVLKRVINKVEEKRKLILKSDNKNGEYPSYSISEKEIMEVWEVTMFASQQIPESTGVEARLNQLESQMVELKESMQ